MKSAIRLAVIASMFVCGVGAAAQDMAGMKDMQKMTRGFAPFTTEAFNAAAQGGKTTLVFFHAPWCPVCKAQEPKVLAHLNGDAKDVVALKIDYDTNLALRKEMKVDKQSTLILFSGAKEIARLSYKSDDASIDALFTHVMMKKDMK